MKKILIFLGSAILVLVIVVLFNTFTFKGQQLAGNVQVVKAEADPTLLSKAIQFPTISQKGYSDHDSVFFAFHRFLQMSFPLTDSLLTKETVNQFSLIYTWQGQNPEKAPLVLMAHMDVVPIEPSSADSWEEEPFSGKITPEYIYGRGTIDDKGSLIAILEAVESLLKQGFKPERTVLLCFGHDEEVGGEQGARQLAVRLKQKGVKAWMVLDEGGTLATGIVPGIDKTVALVGTSEKGYVSLELSARMEGGHSSMPEPVTALETINAAVYKLKKEPMPNRLTAPLEGFISHIGPHLPFVQKMAFANTWLFRPIIYSEYQKSASGAALIHTTQTATIIEGGVKDNVVPTEAHAVINYRLLPGDEPQMILSRAKSIINDSNVQVKIYDDFSVPASPISSHQSPEFTYLSEVIRAVNPDVLVSPYLVLGATDSRYFYNISDQVFRFSPIPLLKDDLPRIHGINERASVKGFERSVTFYATLIGRS